jgi:hypothetical protein
MERNEFTRRRFIAAATTTGLAAMGLSALPAFGGPPYVSHNVGSPDSVDARNRSAMGEEQSWVEIKNSVYGAKPDQQGPTGGGAGYSKIVTKGDYTIESVDALLDALSQVKSGQVIFIPSETVLDLTTRIYIEELVLEIPEGVTLAGDRGNNGSKGALLVSDALKTPGMIRVKGPNVRIAGLRIQGPNGKRYMEHHKRSFGEGGQRHQYYYKFPVSRGIVTESDNLEMDNCEVSAFSHTAIFMMKGTGHHVHHNFIHRCQYNGLGYGVGHGGASSITEHNLFDENRHSIMGTGVSGCGYIARHNIELGISLSHCFDMHGGRDRKDNTDVAGTTIEIYNNTFRAPERAVVIRGVPEDKCEIHHNWILEHQEVDKAVGGISERTTALNNAYSKDPVTVK